ncbi:hypothetical protein J1614_012116 [Plenodomus biglobosus]|nr:hypothetical protein J1614_012116 [Plenodomus biglobosus]
MHALMALSPGSLGCLDMSLNLQQMRPMAFVKLNAFDQLTDHTAMSPNLECKVVRRSRTEPQIVRLIVSTATAVCATRVRTTPLDWLPSFFHISTLPSHATSPRPPAEESPDIHADTSWEL